MTFPMKRKLMILALAVAALLSLGALSQTLLNDLRWELEYRSGRELLNRDLFAGFAPGAAQYFQGRAEGYIAVAHMNLGHPETVAYLRGLGEAILQAAELRERAEQTGTVDTGF